LRIALDTNLLVYAEGVDDAVKQKIALDLIRHIPSSDILLPVQVLGELYYVLTRKAGFSRAAARGAIMGWRDGYSLVATSSAIMLAAADLAVDHQLAIWDAVVLAAAAETDCRLLLSEDLQDGFTWRGVSVTNPFAPTRHPLLDAMLNDAKT
jgi:predicted nucleic acid-binding protein